MKILLIKRENVCYSSLTYFLNEIGNGLVKHGVTVDILDVSANPLLQPDDSRLYEIEMAGYDVAFTFNAVGQQNYKINGENYWDSIGVPFINYIVDHPLQHHKALSEHGYNYYVICIDTFHKEFIRKYYPLIKDHIWFLPHGGIKDVYSDGDIDFSYDGFKARNIDILFTGTYLSLSSIESNINEYPATVRKLIVDHIDYMLSNRALTEEEGLITVLKNRGIDVDTIDMFDYLFATRITEQYVRAYIREEIIRYMIASGLNLRIYGYGWDTFVDDMRNTLCFGSVSFEKTLGLFGRSKVVLDQSSHIKHGMHERIANAMLAGGAVLTDRNDYLESVFKEGLETGELCMFDVSKPQEIPHIAAVMLENDEKLYEMAMRAERKACNEMTWECRAAELLDIIRQII